MLTNKNKKIMNVFNNIKQGKYILTNVCNLLILINFVM